MNAPANPKLRYIPLNKLVPSEHNVRRTLPRTAVEELAANIAAQGLHQNLNVIMRDDGTAEVTAGGRRLHALKLLAGQGVIPADWPVPCLPIAPENARAVSLAENTLRVPMHPDDEFEAFNGLVASGMPIEDVAQRFGVTPAVVKQRMKLAAVSPKLRKIFRAGRMTLEQVMAFTLTDDVKKQEKVWRELDQWSREDADTIKAALTENTVTANHKLVKFVGLKAYEKAGGTLIRDLFDTDTSAYLDNPQLLHQLAEQKLEAAAEKLRAEGWGWVKASLDHQWEGTLGRLKPTKLPDTDDEMDQDDADIEPIYDPEQMKTAGAKISVDYDGRLYIDRGLVTAQSRFADGQDQPPQPDKPYYSARVMDELAHQHTTALRYALSQDPKATMAALTHALASQVLYGSATTSALNIRATSLDTTRPETVPNPEENTAVATMAQQLSRWRKKLPKDQTRLFSWLMKQDDKTVTDLLVLSTSLTLEAVSARHSFERDHRAAAVELGDNLTPAFDMANYWEATAPGFLSRLNKSQMAQALTDSGHEHLAGRIQKLKRDAAATATAEALKGRRWLPAPLKTEPDSR